MNQTPRIICISNRLPVSARESSGALEFVPSSGGLVTAVGPILRKSAGVWIGWPGAVTEHTASIPHALATFSSQSEFELFPVMLDSGSVEGFYHGFSSQIIWPLFHDLQNLCNFDPSYWSTYLQVQKSYAAETVKHATASDLIWVHDYHLMGLGRELRSYGITSKIGFFFHTPFPGPDIFLKLPWRADVIESMLSYDVIGFQTARDFNNFKACLELLTEIKLSTRAPYAVARSAGRDTFLGIFPISIDFTEFDELARVPDVQQHTQTIRDDLKAEFLVLSIDRLDYTKGIPYRIRAFKRLLEKYPDLKKHIVLLQVVVPSRVEVPEYKQLQSDIEKLVTQVNGEHGEPGWVPVQHLFRSLTREEVVAMYQASEVALVTPLKDGMNLVAKEYCASHINDFGALVLSEFAGAADEFKGLAYLVNPYDVEGVATALYTAIKTPRSESQPRMKAMRELISKQNVFTWASSFLKAAQWEWPSVETSPRPATIWDRVRRMSNVFDI